MNYVVFDIETKTSVWKDVTDLEISVISVYEKNTDKMLTFMEDEFSNMWPIFERADALVGYNSESFDIPLLNKYYSGDLTNIKSIDIMVHIKNSFGKRPKLDNVAEFTLGKKKSGHGLQAVEWWEQGKIDEIKKYCEDDVKITKEIFEYILENKSVKIQEKMTNKKVEVPIDTTGWLDVEEKAKITKSLF